MGSQIEANFHNIVKERKEPYLDLWPSEKSKLSHPHNEDNLSGIHLVKLYHLTWFSGSNNMNDQCWLSNFEGHCLLKACSSAGRPLIWFVGVKNCLFNKQLKTSGEFW